MPSTPNLLIVMTDHQRADTIRREHPCQTPHALRLADAGVSFTQTYCPTPHCCPARASFHSGLYPSRHGVWNNICNPHRLSPGPVPGTRLWSSDLAQAGYDLRFIGKWHVDTRTGPADHGWTEHDVTAKGESLMGETWDQVRQWATLPERPRAYGEIHRPGYRTGLNRLFLENTQPDASGDARKTATALDVLDDLAGRDDPWGMFLGLFGPHDPYQAPGEFLDRYDLDDIPLPPNYGDGMFDKPNLYRRMREQVFGQLSEREVREAIRHYWANCTWLDAMFGQILDKLEEIGQADNTLVLYCSDHGDYCGEHGLFAKGIPSFGSAYHVPAVIRWPQGVRRPGREVDSFVSLCDFGPTFLHAAGVTVDRAWSGRSLMPFLRDEPVDSWRDQMLMMCNGVENYVTQRTIRTRDWHYTYNGFDFDELYDLRQDPHQITNLAQDPEYRPITRDMCQRLWRAAEAEQDPPGNSYITVGLAPFGPVEAFRPDA